MARCHRFAPDTELEGGSKVLTGLVESDRGGHGTKTDQSTIEEELPSLLEINIQTTALM